MKVAFVTNFCPHYRVRTYEALARHHDVDYLFFSKGQEWYWPEQHGVRGGAFRHEYLPGFGLGGTRITPRLPLRLWTGGYEAIIKCIVGRFALPASYAVARLKGMPFILWTGVWMRLRSPAHRLLFPLTRYIYRHADAVVVYGEHVKRYLLGEGVAAERIFVAPHAIDNEAYRRPVPAEEQAALRRRLGIEPGDKVVLYLGRLEDGKGLSYLVDAFASVGDRDAVLVIAGSGAEAGALQEHARRQGVGDRVRFPGYVPPEDAVMYYAVAWVYVLPSVTTPVFKEPWGLVVNEAFNQALPVVATNAVGAAAGGLIENGVTGLVVPERDSAAMAAALRRVLAARALRDDLGRRARERVAEWDNERMVRGFRQALDYVSRSARPAAGEESGQGP
jgi:glycosyltransferase involved in cell wall biosynthesis